jgi:3-phenylpropionate/cinnamic acid dioxygenase small subunit
MAELELWHRVQAFLFHEARLLDERRFGEWLALYTPDAEYWVPYAWEQKSPKDHVSLFYETVSLLRMRVDRLENELSPLDTPKARVNHFLSNVTVEDGPELTARAYLLFCEYRREEQRWFAGRSTWRLRPIEQKEEPAGFRIRFKRVDLLNADQDSGHLRFAIPF